MQREITGTLHIYDTGRVLVVPAVGDPLDLVSLLRPWDGQQVRVIAADGKDRRWVVIETEREDGDGNSS